MNLTATGERVHWTSSGLRDDWQDEVTPLIETRHGQWDTGPVLKTEKLRIDLAEHWALDCDIPAIICLHAERGGYKLEFTLRLDHQSFEGYSAVYEITMDH